MVGGSTESSFPPERLDVRTSEQDISEHILGLLVIMGSEMHDDIVLRFCPKSLLAQFVDMFRKRVSVGVANGGTGGNACLRSGDTMWQLS
jgi:hypothetical protein